MATKKDAVKETEKKVKMAEKKSEETKEIK